MEKIKNNINFGNGFWKRSSKVLKKIVNKISLLILLPIDDHQYIHPYRIKESLNKSLKNFKEIETCVNINEALKLIYTRFKKGKF